MNNIVNVFLESDFDLTQVDGQLMGEKITFYNVPSGVYTLYV
jgi:hypothetical protein